MKKSRILHLKTLQELGACANQVELFRKRFGKSVRVTKALCVKVAQDFNFDWAAQNLLTPKEWAEFERAVAAAWAEYKRAVAPAWAEYQRVVASAFAKGYLT